ncbi:hypothetical protein TWF730_010749 [Orbilia blumenaviensis]|uniref:Uncharacterized protein n=1 Tax=Orbilia blumenaviensis TaxID=1796055 RepID=A0AAV9UPL2_9PEZI
MSPTLKSGLPGRTLFPSSLGLKYFVSGQTVIFMDANTTIAELPNYDPILDHIRGWAWSVWVVVWRFLLVRVLQTRYPMAEILQAPSNIGTELT